jgi:ribosomal protein L1
MNEDALNLSIRKFLKHFGVTAQREIEHAVQRGLADGTLRGDETVPVRATLTLDGLVRDFHIDATITLA